MKSVGELRVLRIIGRAVRLASAALPMPAGATAPALLPDFEVNGKAARPIRWITYGESDARCSNMLRDSQFLSDLLEWRVEHNSYGSFTLGRNHSAAWRLANEHTLYAALAPTIGEARLVYGASAQEGAIPVRGNEVAQISGLLASHRCLLTAVVHVRDAEGRMIDTREFDLPKASGGQHVENYASMNIEVPLPEGASSLSLEVMIKRMETAGAELDAFVFMAKPGVYLQARRTQKNPVPDFHSPAGYYGGQLSTEEAGLILSGSSIVDAILPMGAVGLAGPTMLAVLEPGSGAHINGSPVLVPRTASSQLSMDRFDGTLLHLQWHGAADAHLRMMIDGAFAAQVSVPSTPSEEPADLRFRIPDRYLDGHHHDIDIVDAATGTLLCSNTEIVAPELGHWRDPRILTGTKQPPFHTFALQRRFYSSIAQRVVDFAGSHQAKTAGLGETASFRQFSLALRIVEDDSAKRGTERLNLSCLCPAGQIPDATLIVFLEDAVRLRQLAAELVLSHRQRNLEVIVLCGKDAMSALRAQGGVDGIQLVVWERSESLASAINVIASTARGHAICLLAADLAPGFGWLDELLAALDANPSADVAAAAILDAQGRLENCGGALSSDGKCTWIGAGSNPDVPATRYIRPVRLVAGDACAVRKSAWVAGSGLAEEGITSISLAVTDLALRRAEAGRLTLFAPTAQLERIRRERPGAADLAPAKDVQNTATDDEAFIARWIGKAGAFPSLERPRALMVDLEVPRPDRDAGSYAARQDLRMLQALGFQLSYLPISLADDAGYGEALRREGIEFINAPFAISASAAIAEREGLFDLVYITRYHVAREVLPAIRRFQPRAKVVFLNADLHFLRELRAAQADGDVAAMALVQETRDRELQVIRDVDVTLSYNEIEHTVIASHLLNETRVALAPWVAEPVSNPAPFDQRDGLAFLGFFGHAPNLQALEAFSRDVLPLLRRRMPDLVLRVYGSLACERAAHVEGPGIEIIGHVPDLADALQSARLFIAPLVSGAGLKGKVINAFAHGLPCILSPIAAEGIGAHAGGEYIEASTPEQWVEAIVSLYNDPLRWAEIASAATRLLATRYSFAHGLKLMSQALAKAGVKLPTESTGDPHVDGLN